MISKQTTQKKFHARRSWRLRRQWRHGWVLRNEPDVAVVGAEKEKTVERKNRHCGQHSAHDVTC